MNRSTIINFSKLLKNINILLNNKINNLKNLYLIEQ